MKQMHSSKMLDIPEQHSKNVQTLPILLDTSLADLPFASKQIKAIQRESTRKGYNIAFYADCEKYLADSNANPVVIVLGFECVPVSDILIQLDRAGKCPIITMTDAEYVDPYHSYITFSRRAITEQMVGYLTQKGCRHFAMVGCCQSSANDLVHIQAMKDCLAMDQCSSEVFFYQNLVEESFSAFYDRHEQFDAVLCPNDYCSIAFLCFCERKGLRIPTDLKLASFKETIISSLCSPSLTSCSFDQTTIAKNA